MRLLSMPWVTALVLAMIAGPSAVSQSPAAADDMQTTTCPPFTGTSWVSPMPPNNSGNRYAVTLTGREMSCAQAVSWSRKLIAQHIAGKPMMPQYPPLKGGPAGYICTGSPDNTGHAWRGHCLKIKHGAFAPGFDWTDD